MHQVPRHPIFIYKHKLYTHKALGGEKTMLASEPSSKGMAPGKNGRSVWLHSLPWALMWLSLFFFFPSNVGNNRVSFFGRRYKSQNRPARKNVSRQWCK